MGGHRNPASRVQVVGLQETVCSEADLLHHAMTLTKEALGTPIPNRLRATSALVKVVRKNDASEVV